MSVGLRSLKQDRRQAMSPLSQTRCRYAGPRRPIFALLALAVTLFVTLVATGCGSDEGTGELNGMTRNPPNSIGDLTLPQVNPESVNSAGSLVGAKGGLTLVYFGFTYCPDVCPTTLADVRVALEELDRDERSRIRFAMVTVDPERDTPAVLNDYLDHFFDPGSFSALRTTDRKELRKAERRFGASHRIGRPDSDGNYDVDHTAQLYAVDEDGVVAVEWPFGTEASDIEADLRELLRRSEEQGRT